MRNSETISNKQPFVRNEIFMFLGAKEVLMSPEMAKEFLLKNYKNRPKNLDKVEAFIQILKDGKWDKSKHEIQILEDGRLIDGQHRLTAVWKTGISVPVIVKTFRLMG